MKDTKSSERIIQVKDINLGDSISKLRKNKGIKQIDMVTRLQLYGIDISIYSYNRIEKGTQNPTVSLLSALCDILECDYNMIFEGI